MAASPVRVTWRENTGERPEFGEGMPRMSSLEAAEGAREALENGKGAEEAQNTEAALRHFDRAIRLSSGNDGDEVQAEATYRKAHLLFSQGKYVECQPPLRAYLEQDPADALSFGEQARNYLDIAEMESSPNAAVIAAAERDPSDTSTGDVPFPSYQVDLNPAHQQSTAAVEQRFDGRLSGGRLRTSGGRTYSAPEPAADSFEQDGRAGGSSSVQQMCCGRSTEDQCLCWCSVVMASLTWIMCIYGITA